MIRVDYTNTTVYNDKRYSVRIESSSAYGPGSVFVLDAGTYTFSLLYSSLTLALVHVSASLRPTFRAVELTSFRFRSVAAYGQREFPDAPLDMTPRA